MRALNVQVEGDNKMAKYGNGKSLGFKTAFKDAVVKSKGKK
jgi:hypothetical protein